MRINTTHHEIRLLLEKAQVYYKFLICPQIHAVADWPTTPRLTHTHAHPHTHPPWYEAVCSDIRSMSGRFGFVCNNGMKTEYFLTVLHQIMIIVILITTMLSWIKTKRLKFYSRKTLVLTNSVRNTLLVCFMHFSCTDASCMEVCCLTLILHKSHLLQ